MGQVAGVWNCQLEHFEHALSCHQDCGVEPPGEESMQHPTPPANSKDQETVLKPSLRDVQGPLRLVVGGYLGSSGTPELCLSLLGSYTRLVLIALGVPNAKLLSSFHFPSEQRRPWTLVGNFGIVVLLPV